MIKKRVLFTFLIAAIFVVFGAGAANAAFVDISSSFEGTYSFTGDGAGGDFSYDVIFDIWQGTGADDGLYQYRYVITNYVNDGTISDATRSFETLIVLYNAVIVDVGYISNGGVDPADWGSNPYLWWEFDSGDLMEGDTSDILWFTTPGYPEGMFTTYGNVLLGDATGQLPGAAAPEPSTFLLLGMGIVGCFAGFRKRFQKA